MTAALTLALTSCGSTSQEVAAAPAQNAVEAFAPNLPFVSEDDLQGLSANMAVKVIRKHKFSDGTIYNYVTFGNDVIDGDMILGDVDKLEKGFTQYETDLKNGIKPQGAMTNRCTFGYFFGACAGAREGLRWDRSTPPNVYPPMSNVYYEPMSNLNADTRYALERAMVIIRLQTGSKVNFVQSSTAPDRIRFTEYNGTNGQSGCWSKLGRQGGVQELNLDVGCRSEGIAIHELLHALGMMHEHQRADRDNYVTINVSNLTNFGKPQLDFKYWDRDMAERTAFDLGSIMMYPQYINNTQFVINTALPAFTLKVPIPSGVVIGQRNALSVMDIETLNARYQ